MNFEEIEKTSCDNHNEIIKTLSRMHHENVGYRSIIRYTIDYLSKCEETYKDHPNMKSVVSLLRETLIQHTSIVIKNIYK